MGVVVARTQTAAVLAALTTAGLNAAVGRDPANSGWTNAPGQSTFRPYAVVWPVPGGSTDGTLAHPDEDAQSLYQVTGVGSTVEQAEWVADVARIALLAPGAVEITDPSDTRVVQTVTIDTLGGCRRDDDVDPAVWITADRFRVLSTP